MLLKSYKKQLQRHFKESNIDNFSLSDCAEMPYCIAYGCSNRSEDYQRGISFFQLPLKNKALLEKWLAKLRLEDPPLKETSRLCSAHFTDEALSEI